MNWEKVKFDLTLASFLQLFQKLVGYFILAFLARHLDKNVMGDFFFAVTYASIFASLTQLGTGQYLIRRISEASDDVLKHLSEVLSVRVPLILMSFVLMNTIAWLVMPAQILIVMLTAVYIFAMNLYLTFGSMFTGLHLMSYRAATAFVGQILLVVLVIASIQHEFQLHGILLCYITANMTLLVGTALIVRYRFGRFGLAWDRPMWRQVVTPSIMFFLITFLNMLAFKVDTLMLRFMTSSTVVADYEAAYKFLEASRIAVRPVGMVFFPICAQMFVQGNWPGFQRIARKLVGGVGILGIAIAVCVVLLAPLLISMMWGGQYGNSIPILQVLFIAAPALYIVFVGIFLSNSLHLERKVIRILLASLIGNIAFNFLVIPWWGAIGAAWTTVATEVLFAIGLVWLILAKLRAWRDPPASGGVQEQVAIPNDVADQYEDAWDEDVK